MRYYVYISETKVEMLYSQIPEKLLESIAGKLTIDLKLIKTEFSETPKEKTLHSKIEIIENYIANHGLLGDSNKPNEYIKGKDYFRWGPYTSGLVYFGSKKNVIIGLAGSEKHVIGSPGDSPTYSHSATPYLIAALNDQIKSLRGANDDTETPESKALSAVELATAQMTGLKQNMEYLAKTLLYYPSDNIEYTWNEQSGLPIILGSPIYVAII